jgi:ectoine hydroxylase-related dioxygenase (phytanoyl-CoA dioxygenase family)
MSDDSLEIIQKSVDDFRINGFTVLRSFLKKKEIEIARKDVQKIFSILKKKNFGPPFVFFTEDLKIDAAHKLHKIFPNTPLLTFAKKKIIKDFYKNLFKDNSVLENLQIFAKPKKSGGETPFHQDNWYWNTKDKSRINVWIALDRVTKRNAGVIYYKGSHKHKGTNKYGLIKHVFPKRYAGFLKGIANTDLNKLKYKKYTANLYPGDCIIHTGEVVHGAKKNKSNINRRGVVLSIAGKKTKYDKNQINIYKKELANQVLSSYD